MVLRWSIQRPVRFRLRGCHPLWLTFPGCIRLTTGFVTLQGTGRPPVIDSYNPSSETAAAYLADLVWAVPVSLATTKGIISFPPATEMFQFAGLPPHGLYIQPRVTGHDPSRVSPFGHLCFKARLRLHTAYRSLPRPSSAIRCQGIHHTPLLS